MAPAYARQDSGATSSSPNASATQTGQSGTAPAAAASGAQSGQTASDTNLQPLQAERHEGFWGKINPLARKKYVQRQMAPVRDRLNELDELTAANAKSIKDVDGRAQEGIRMASARANEADQHATDAGNRAQAAGETAQQANSHLQTVQQAVANLDQYQPVTDAEILLRPGQTTLSRKAKDALDQMAETAKNQKTYLFEVQGFSRGHGATAIENSQHMAEAVVRYLVINHDVPVYRIYLLGRGNAPMPAAAGESVPVRTQRDRVEVSLLKNASLEQLASTTPIQTPVSSSGSGSAAQGGATGTAVQSAPEKAPSSEPGNRQPASHTGNGTPQN
jgi:outer membrane protein OmpA-like peptidoglycan-associated protein